MTLTNPPGVITNIANKLTASGSLPAGWTLWYPSAPEDTAQPFVLIEATATRQKVAEGILGFLTGEGSVTLFVDDSIGNLESVADDICEGLMADVGLIINDASYELATDKADGNDDESERTITITFNLGIGG